jgi:hypothetical protein
MSKKETFKEREKRYEADPRYKKVGNCWVFTPSEEDICEGRNIISIPDERGLKDRDPIVLNDSWIKAFDKKEKK